MAQTQTPTRFLAGDCEMMEHTPSSAVYAGDVIVSNGGTFVALSAIEANALGALVVRGGRFAGPNGGHGFTVNDKVYWDADGNPVGGTEVTGAITRVASGNTFLGVCTKTAISTDETVEFLKGEGGAANS